MAHIGLTPFKFDVGGLHAQLAANPGLWNGIPHRTNFDNSPHREVDDIWLRYNSIVNLRGKLTQEFNDCHESVWYPSADVLSEAKTLSIALQLSLGADELGGILITRVGAGKQVYPHIDRGWHARYYDKYIIQILSAPGQRFCFEGESLDARVGECYWFDNAFSHWVENPTTTDRISLIVCLRTNRCH